MLHLFCLVLCLFIPGTNAFQWTSGSPDDHSNVYACEGTDVTLPWDFHTNTTETLVNIKWFVQHDRDANQQIVATFVGGHFFSDNANVQHVPQAGLHVSEVRVKDIYSVTVDIASSSGLTSYTRSASVTGAVPPVVDNGRLQLKQGSSAMMDERTGTLFVQLQCGDVTSLGQPPVTVQWTAPSGQLLDSSSFDNNTGSFALNLYDPVETGNYSCFLDNQTVHSGCLAPWHMQKSSLSVDGQRVRMVILEAENRELKQQVHEITEHLHQQQLEIEDLRRNASHMASLLQRCGSSVSTATMMSATTSPPTTATTTTATTTPSTTTTSTTTEKVTSVPCVNTMSHCELYVRMWQCRDAGQGSLYRHVCRRYCGLCNEPIVGK